MTLGRFLNFFVFFLLPPVSCNLKGSFWPLCLLGSIRYNETVPRFTVQSEMSDKHLADFELRFEWNGCRIHLFAFVYQVSLISELLTLVVLAVFNKYIMNMSFRAK